MKRIFIIILSIISFVFGTLVSPSDGDELNYIHILFEWEQQPDAIGYNLQVSTDEFFNNLILDVDETYTVYIDSDNFNWDDTYYWRVRPIYSDGVADQWIGSSSFSTKEAVLTNLDVDIYNDSLIQEGLVMYSQFSPYLATGVIDKFGREIWNMEYIYMNHVNDYGQLYGLSGQGILFNFDQEILWTTPDGIEIDSHEIKQIPNGNFMAFVPTYQMGPIALGAWTNHFQTLGYQADGVTNEFPWMGLRIVEFDENTHQEVWDWNPFEHFSMNDFDVYDISWWVAAFGTSFDWMHSNAFHFDAEESVIYVSHRHLSRISKIAYPSGEVIWNMGLPDEYNTGEDNICEDLLFSFQHHIQLLDDGTLLFFDNGNLSYMFGDEYPTTRIRRIRVIDDSYCETVWQYDLPSNLYGGGMGSVQLLENGNYSIYTYGNGQDEGGDVTILEITQEGEMIWKATSQNESAAWYRAYKIPSIHPDAFSVIADNYTVDENNNNIIQILGNSLDFTVINKSGYTQPYQFSFGESTDGPPMFDYEEGDFTLGPNESIELSFEVLDESISSTNINFSIWPVHHDYALKELSYNITTNDTLLGDLNGDGTINVVDIVMLVNIILNGEEYYPVADLNSDGTINVVDIVTLVNIILN